MENGGNAKVNAIFEAHLNVSKPNNSASGSVRERFIRDKYERRKFYDPRAFESAAQMSNGGVEEEAVIAGVQRRLASDRYARTPSDAAKRRVEERAARNRSGGGTKSSSSRSKPVKKPAPVKAPEPVADLLDFGDFTSVEAASTFQQNTTTPAPAASVAATPAPAAAPPAAIDMFANMSSPVQNAPATPQQHQQQPEKKAMSNADIMSMFNSPSTQHNPMQQNMFPMQMGGGMNGGNNMMMNGNNNNMGMMNQQQMGMNNMGMGGNNNMNQPMMGMQNGMMQMNQQPMGMNNMMGGNNMNQMMMMQQQQMQQQQMQQNQMQQMNMMGGNMGGNNNMMGGSNNMMNGSNNMMMQGGNQFGSPMGQTQQKRSNGSNVNQFADFGNFGR